MGSDETLKQDDSPVLKAIAELAQRLDKFEQNTNAQFKAVDAQLEAIREGIVHSNVKFDRLAADVYEARADISKLRASLTELTEEVRQSRKSLV
jgi:septal ring factor EnvC (AmiA/AmiB activator)